MLPTKSPEGTLLIAHTADWHLRDAQYNRLSRGDDFFASARDLINKLASPEYRPDIIVNVGDIFNVARPSARVIGQLMEIDKMLQVRNLTMLCVTGNHDLNRPQTWLEVLFPDRELDGLGIIPFDNKTHTYNGVTICGLPPLTKGEYTSQKEVIRNHLTGGKVDVLLYHYLVSGVADLPPLSNDLPVEELPTDLVKAILLGDVHKTSHITHGDCLVAFPGSIEMCESAEDKDKTAFLIRVSVGGFAGVAGTVPIRTRPCITFEAHNEADLDEAVESIRDIVTAGATPLVIGKYDRDIPGVLSRLYSVVDPREAVVRLTPLPRAQKGLIKLAKDKSEIGLSAFVEQAFPEGTHVQRTAVDLALRGETDAQNILATFAEERLKELKSQRTCASSASN